MSQLIAIMLQLIKGSINTFYSFIGFSLQINSFILLLNCIVLIFALDIHFLFL